MTLCDDTQYVYFLSATEAGRLHDKKLADEYALHLPAGSVLRQDLGLLGHAPAGVRVEMPHKKPPKRELTFSQKLYNQLLSRELEITYKKSKRKDANYFEGIAVKRLSP